MRVSKISRLSLAAILAVGFLFTSFNSLQAQASANHKANIITDEFTPKSGEYGWQQGQKVSDLQFNDVFTKKFSLYDKLTKPTIIEISDMESPDALKNKKYLKSFYKQYDVNIISIVNSKYPNQIRDFIKTNELSWSTVLDDSKKFTGKTFAESQNLSRTKLLLIMPDKTVHTVVASSEPVGKLGLALQQHFN